MKFSNLSSELEMEGFEILAKRKRCLYFSGVYSYRDDLNLCYFKLIQEEEELALYIYCAYRVLSGEDINSFTFYPRNQEMYSYENENKRTKYRRTFYDYDDSDEDKVNEVLQVCIEVDKDWQKPFEKARKYVEVYNNNLQGSLISRGFENGLKTGIAGVATAMFMTRKRKKFKAQEWSTARKVIVCLILLIPISFILLIIVGLILSGNKS